MKGITLRLREGRPDDVLQRLRMSQELGFEEIDLAVSGPRAPLAEALRLVRGAGGKVGSVRLADPRDLAARPHRLGFSKLSSVNEEVRAASVALTLGLCRQLQGAQPRVPVVVVDGGSVDFPGAVDLAVRLETALEDESQDVQGLVSTAGDLRAPHATKHLDALCRSLFDLTKALEGVRFTVVTPDSPLGVCLPDEMAHLLSDLKPAQGGYWHSTSSARRLEKMGVVPQEQWLERFGSRMLGIYLGDAIGAQGDQAPGLGEVNFRSIKPYLGQGMSRVMTISDDTSSCKLKFGADYLVETGIF